MKKRSIDELVQLLHRVMNDAEPLRSQGICRFQRAVWQDIIEYPTVEVAEVMRQLAYDLDYYEPDPDVRLQDKSYYGETRLIREIMGCLENLPRLGQPFDGEGAK